jgi:hypothetical protein
VEIEPEGDTLTLTVGGPDTMQEEGNSLDTLSHDAAVTVLAPSLVTEPSTLFTAKKLAPLLDTLPEISPVINTVEAPLTEPPPTLPEIPTVDAPSILRDVTVGV